MSDKCGRCGMLMNHEVHQGVFGEFHDFDHVSKEIRDLVARGNITSAEISELRCNSWEWEALVPAMTDEAFVERMQYSLDNCFTRRERPFTTYNQAVEGLWAPELLTRFKKISGIQSRCIVCGATQTAFYSCRSTGLSCIFRKCQACSIESEIGTEENPHPVPEQFHTCRPIQARDT